MNLIQSPFERKSRNIFTTHSLLEEFLSRDQNKTLEKSFQFNSTIFKNRSVMTHIKTKDNTFKINSNNIQQKTAEVVNLVEDGKYAKKHKKILPNIKKVQPHSKVPVNKTINFNLNLNLKLDINLAPSKNIGLKLKNDSYDYSPFTKKVPNIKMNISQKPKSLYDHKENNKIMATRNIENDVAKQTGPMTEKIQVDNEIKSKYIKNKPISVRETMRVYPKKIIKLKPNIGLNQGENLIFKNPKWKN
jgi:hypothetical protein